MMTKGSRQMPACPLEGLPARASRLANQRGVAMLTILLLMVMLTVVGIGALSITGSENKMAGFGRTADAAANAAEACVGTSVKIIQDTIDAAQLPVAYKSDANPPGPVPSGNAGIVQAEIMGQSDNNSDAPDVAPNTSATINGFLVRGDLDRLYVVPRAGSSMNFGSGYEGLGGGAAAGGADILYRIDCLATNSTTNTRGRIVAVYACMATGESCQRKI